MLSVIPFAIITPKPLQSAQTTQSIAPHHCNTNHQYHNITYLSCRNYTETRWLLESCNMLNATMMRWRWRLHHVLKSIKCRGRTRRWQESTAIFPIGTSTNVSRISDTVLSVPASNYRGDNLPPTPRSPLEAINSTHSAHTNNKWNKNRVRGHQPNISEYIVEYW